MLDSNVFRELNESTFFEELSESKDFALPQQCDFQIIKQIIERELVGLGNPVVVKDCFIPICLFREGGFYFDLDFQATKAIDLPKSLPYGILLNEGGVNPNCIAAAKEHPFCILALIELIRNYQSLPELIQASPQQYRSHLKSNPYLSPVFLDIDALRDRKNPLRSPLICLTSGGMFKPALKQLMKLLDLSEDEKISFLQAVNFIAEKNNAAEYTMRVKHLTPEELVPQRRVEQGNSFASCLKYFLCCCNFGKKSSAETKSVEGEAENWRNKKATKTSFEESDSKPPKKSPR